MSRVLQARYRSRTSAASKVPAAGSIRNTQRIKHLQWRGARGRLGGSYSRRMIAIAMRTALNDKFQRQLYAQVEALQISQVELPVAFQDALLLSIATKQNITRSERYKELFEQAVRTIEPVEICGDAGDVVWCA